MSGQNAPEKVKSPSFFIENILTEDKHKNNKICQYDEEKKVCNEDQDNERGNSLPSICNENSSSQGKNSSGGNDDSNSVTSPEGSSALTNGWCSSLLSMNKDKEQDINELSDDGNYFSQDDILHKFRSKKKTRTVFSRHQIFYLESAFDTKKYLSSSERADIAATLNLTETQVKVWFQNRRNKWKSQVSGDQKQSADQEPSYMLPFPGSGRLMNFRQLPPSFSGFPLYRHRFLYF